MLLWALRLGIIVQIWVGVCFLLAWAFGQADAGWAFGLAIILAYPVVWAHLVVVPLVLGRIFIVKPRQRRMVQASKKIFANFKGIKIAIAGSYGKTSMKELLLTVLSEGKRVAATPANKNVSISHAQFAQKLLGNEDILIIEYGEGQPGDVARFTAITAPTHAVITGVAAAHLDKYKTVHNAGKDIFSVATSLPPEAVFVNSESADAEPFVKAGYQRYNENGVFGWKVSNVQVSLEGTAFTLRRGGQKLELHSKLLGRHQVGPLALAAALAVEFGLSSAEVRAGVAKTAPFEHRMQPYQLAGAWIIDDTYNGNVEGIRAGTNLLKELPAKRKIYVTPGLVDQGKHSAAIHNEIGHLIAKASPDIVVLMEHSVTPHIQKGLEEAHYKGEVIVEADPLNFYNNLQVFVAHGDVVMMQNDWPDNYR
jgi:UDP-N-acetylmuramoyl-tripeptide--D-alanyl-D-alanine ligase